MNAPRHAATVKFVAPHVIEVTVVYLEMMAKPQLPPPPAPSISYRVELVRNPSVPFYRYLYSVVGEPWLWHERRKVSDTELAAILADPAVWLLVAYAEGEPAGYAELSGRRPPDVELAYFGIVPKFIGRGLGPALLRAAIDFAWEQKPRRLWVHTCSLDHPKALPCYQRAGFTSYDKVVRRIRDPRPLPLHL